MNKPIISVVVTDLDNTLFDWFTQWYESFNAMLAELVKVSGLPRETLIPEIKQIHEKHKTSEYAFLIEEIPSLQKQFPNDNLLEKFKPAIEAYRAARRTHLKLYPTVATTLRLLKARGVRVVAYTESMAFYTNYRIRKLGLDGLIDVLYSPPDHDLPANVTAEQIRKYPAQHYQFKHTEHRHTPQGQIKPNPKILLSIMDDLGAVPSQCLYVGDDLVKDISMAQDAGVIDVLAEYGAAHRDQRYELLKQVTHWTPAAVAAQQKATKEQSKPTVVLVATFSEILEEFDFVGFGDSPNALEHEFIEAQLKIWTKVVDVQQHFNDIELRIRNMAFTFLGAVVAGVALTLKDKVTLGTSNISLAAILLVAGAAIFAGFWFMDRHWYHRLLYGAVKTGMEIEKQLERVGLRAALTETIGKESPIRVAGVRLRSGTKLNLFYGSFVALLSVTGLWLIDGGLGIGALTLWIFILVGYYASLPEP